MTVGQHVAYKDTNSAQCDNAITFFFLRYALSLLTIIQAERVMKN